VVDDIGSFLRSHDLPDALVHLLDHAPVGVNVATVQVEELAVQLGRLAHVLPSLPGPVRPGVVQTQHEGRWSGSHAADPVDGPLRDQIGQIAMVNLTSNIPS